MAPEMYEDNSIASELRRRAEDTASYPEMGERRAAIEPNAAWRMLHDLRVHQYELHMQNEELLRTQAELDAARSHYFDLYDLAPVGYCTISGTEHILEANLTAATLMGLPCSKLVSKPFQQFIAFADQDIYYLHCKELMATGQPQSCELRMIKQDGSQFWARLTATQSSSSAPQAAHRLVLTDISERKRLDQALLEKNLALQHATLVAEKANRAKSDFLSSMSHELRSPLNAILGFAQLLETGTPALTPAQQVKTENIQRGGWYLLKLINDILDVALIESGKLALSLAPLSLARVLLDCQSLVEPQAERHGVRVDFPQLTSQVLVMADPVRLQQVIINLLSNAIKYNRIDGVVNVTVAATEAGVVRISVHDTGEGMSEEKLAQLFEPFNRLGQEGSTEEGTGIGLVVTRRLVELMGGKIGVQSTVGVGSVFWIELSAAQALSVFIDDKTASTVDDQRQAGARLDPTPCTVLYVEDNQANMELVEQILAVGRPNVHLLRAQNGTQGIEMARNHSPQVILMDVNLPGISGLEVVRILRQDPATRQIPVLAISANALPQDITTGISAGFFSYLTKPFKIEEFLEELDQAVATGPSMQPQSKLVVD